MLTLLQNMIVIFPAVTIVCIGSFSILIEFTSLFSKSCEDQRKNVTYEVSKYFKGKVVQVNETGLFKDVK